MLVLVLCAALTTVCGQAQVDKPAPTAASTTPKDKDGEHDAGFVVSKVRRCTHSHGRCLAHYTQNSYYHSTGRKACCRKRFCALVLRIFLSSLIEFRHYGRYSYSLSLLSSLLLALAALFLLS